MGTCALKCKQSLSFIDLQITAALSYNNSNTVKPVLSGHPRGML